MIIVDKSFQLSTANLSKIKDMGVVLGYLDFFLPDTEERAAAI